ncbi:FAD-dependent oxidoreductase [Methylocystis echinoides]|uniref:FAD-dependent oxidoreductase n=1 Tax=Methylocystis echinoides TaxID=29468 RepID=UPI00342DAA4A
MQSKKLQRGLSLPVTDRNLESSSMRSTEGGGRRVAILGAGIMGASLALFLARHGFRVSLFDRENVPLAGASRWNEGKIHLGYLYGADPSLDTARRVIPGGLNFGPLISKLIGADISPAITEQDDIYLIHRDSVATPEAVAATFEGVSALLREHPDSRRYLVDVSRANFRRMSRKEVGNVANDDLLTAGFVTPERSVDTRWIADRLCDALLNESRISFCPGIAIKAATPVDSVNGPWRVRGTPDVDDRFDIVVNALWHGRLEIDLTAGAPAPDQWSNRFRHSLFIQTPNDLDLPSVVVAFGPFGDVKNYNGRDFYASWYPAGLIFESNEISPPALQPWTTSQQKELIAKVRAALGELLPWTSKIFDSAETIVVQGGFVFAQGRGSLADPRSTLHRRDRFGILRRGRYYSVDTGKYSTAPWLAWNLAQELIGN